MASHAVEGTGTLGWEHRRDPGGQKDRGHWATGIACVESMMMMENSEKKKKGRGPKGWTAAARKDGIVLSRSRPAWRDHGTWCHPGR